MPLTLFSKRLVGSVACHLSQRCRFIVLNADEDEDAAGVVAVRDVQEWNNDPASTDDALDEALLVGNERSADVDSLRRRQPSLLSQFLAILRARFTIPKYVTDTVLSSI